MEWGDTSSSIEAIPPAALERPEAEKMLDMGKRKRKYRGPMMALSDENLRLGVAGKTQLGA